MSDLQQVKDAKKAKNPKFVRDESFKRSEVGPSWRKPRGQCSKVRKCKAGHMAMPNVGYRTPVALRGALRSGLVPVTVENVAQVKDLDKKTQCAMVSSAVGARKKLAILKALDDAGIKIANLDSKKFADDLKKKQDERKAKKAAAKKAKEEKETPKKSSKKKSAKKKTVESETKDEGTDSGSEEKKELDKILSKKQ